MPGSQPTCIRLYRIAHINNVEHILTHGMYTQQSPHCDPNYTSIGDTQLIGQRHNYSVKIKGCGNLGDYIPFYLGGHSPMLLNIKTGYRGITQRPQNEIVYIVCKLDDILANCSEWVFTDGHAKDNLSGHYNNLKDLDKVDWAIVNAQYWSPNDVDYDRQRRKQAEFLVKNHVPVCCIEKIVVRDNNSKRFIDQIKSTINLTINVEVDINNRLYYP